MINIAAQNGFCFLLDPIETSSWLRAPRTNGVGKGRLHTDEYLGSRYKDFPNIIWLHGNDFQSWHNCDG